MNALTTRANCPQSRQPELKHAAVRLAAAELPWSLAAAAWLPAGEALAVREAMRALLAPLPYALIVPLGEEPAEQICLMVNAAAEKQPPEALLRDLAVALGLQGEQLLSYADARSGHHRAVRLDEHGVLASFLFAGDTASAGWMLEWLRERRPAAPLGRALLANAPRPPAASEGASRGPMVCTCNAVDETSIQAALVTLPQSLSERACVEQLQETLRCGSTCGSCLPAVKGLVRQRHKGAAKVVPA